jgi:hypothetical protein
MLIPYDPVILCLLMDQMQEGVCLRLHNITSSAEEWRVSYKWKMSPDIETTRRQETNFIIY